MKVRDRRRRNRILIRIFNGFGRSQSGAVVVLYFVPRNSQDQARRGPVP